ncbi:Uncharacterized iron-regulated membrane protein [bacterium A37T11]|nr:Uncharacterized iron-regulated membrane protein [bacterium A37T11]
MYAVTLRMRFKKTIGFIHLWLGLVSGLFVLFMGVTGCILAFETEIENATQEYRFTQKQQKTLLKPSVLKAIAEKALPNKIAHSVTYEDGRSAVVTFYNDDPEYYFLTFINPYSGELIKLKDMSNDFFRFIIGGHYYLWLPPNIGQPIVATGTLIFLVMLISGLILWWPRNKAGRKQRFKIKFNAKWKRVNYDLHNVVGFYMLWAALLLAMSGLVMGFQWFSKSVYWVASGGKQKVEFYAAPSSASTTKGSSPAYDALWEQAIPQWQQMQGSLEVHFPEADSVAVELAFNPDTETYWKADYRYYDQETLKEIPVRHTYGLLKNTSAADKLLRMNYDIHVGAIAGIPGKILAFLSSLTAASLPITGFMIWWGRKKKKVRRF